MLTKDDHLKAVYSSDIDAFLAKLDVLEQFNQGKFACKYCKEVITRHNLYAIIPMPNKNVDIRMTYLKWQQCHLKSNQPPVV